MIAIIKISDHPTNLKAIKQDLEKHGLAHYFIHNDDWQRIKFAMGKVKPVFTKTKEERVDYDTQLSNK